MGDDIGSGSVCFDFRSTNVVQLSNWKYVVCGCQTTIDDSLSWTRTNVITHKSPILALAMQRPILKEKKKKTKKEWIQNFLYCPVAGSLTLTGSGTKVYPGPYPSLLYLHSERGSLLRKSPIKSQTVNGNHSIVSLFDQTLLSVLVSFRLFWFLFSLFFSALSYLFLNQKYLKLGQIV